MGKFLDNLNINNLQVIHEIACKKDEEIMKKIKILSVDENSFPDIEKISFMYENSEVLNILIPIEQSGLELQKIVEALKEMDDMPDGTFEIERHNT